MNILLELLKITEEEFYDPELGDLELTDDDIYNGQLPEELKGIRIHGNFDCRECESLSSLENAPNIVDEDCDFANAMKLTSLEGIGKDYLLEIGGDLYLPLHLKSNALGILRIKKLTHVINNSFAIDSLKRTVTIINKHLESGRNIWKCKEELIEAGLKEYAKL